MLKKNGFAPILILILLLAAIAGIYVISKSQTKISQSTPSSIPTVNSASNWKTYTNKEIGFRIDLPPSFSSEQVYNEGSIQQVFFNEIIGTESKRHISVDRIENPTNGESRDEKNPSGPPIISVENSFQGVSDLKTFEFQGYPAARGVVGALPKELNSLDYLDIYFHILKNKTLWQISISYNKTQGDINDAEKIFSTFHFTD